MERLGADLIAAALPSGDGRRSGISKATALPLPLVLEGAWIEVSTVSTGRPEGAVEVRVGAGVEGEVISTFIASSVTIRERLLGALAVVEGNKGQSPEGVEVIGRGGGGISGLITEGAGGEVIV
ncbi:hypothetical protein RhiirA1_484852 [Rhizophagus irregularis]|uniref:Uncharacterized protein n=1 Tax=Rhizophagus irregularis TaxID=588596 RepID=A0A2N0QIU7_9GLOM|nr:hypothetical protein RhiirA1_484852 [Rhizophagus irregularis]